MDKIIEVSKLEKKYGEVRALEDISFAITRGRVVGLLGPSGSGKSTLLKILSAISKADSGSVKIFGKDIDYKTKEKIAYKADDLIIGEDLRIGDFVNLYADFYPKFSKDYIIKLLDYLNLDRSQRLKGLSKGQRQMLSIALNFSKNVDLYLLDEIFDGLDPNSTNKLLDLLIDKIDEKKTIIIASQQIELVENLLDDVIFLNNGKIHYMGTAKDIRQKASGDIIEFYDRIYLD